jgi:hypothetical protein
MSSTTHFPALECVEETDFCWFLGFPDPFAVATLNGEQTNTTSVIKRTLNPYWNETFEMCVLSSVPGGVCWVVSFADEAVGVRRRIVYSRFRCLIRRSSRRRIRDSWGLSMFGLVMWLISILVKMVSRPAANGLLLQYANDHHRDAHA